MRLQKLLSDFLVREVILFSFVAKVHLLFSVFVEHTRDIVASPNTYLAVSDDVLHAEDLLVKVITSYYLFNSSKEISRIFSKIFPDSQFAQPFSCKATKRAYLAYFGIHPYFQKLSVERICQVKEVKKK